MLPSEMAILNEGERYLPRYQAYNAAMHLGHMASYREALRYSYGRRVLDIGCGVGYGAFFLASYGATRVIALDLGILALRYAQTTYAHANLNYLQGSALRLPFADNAFDFVFSSQVIEHVPNVSEFLWELRRVLAPAGQFLIVTPNQALFSPNGLSANLHHLSEMNWAVFRQQIKAVFPQAYFYGIPQKCLQILPGSSTPVTKPNHEIRLADYVPQTHDLDECENMLGSSQMLLAPPTAPALPKEIRQLTQTLYPIFWDQRVKQWILLGLSGVEETYKPLKQHFGQKLTVQFSAPLPLLYAIELDLAEELQYPLSVTLFRQSTSSTKKDFVADFLIRPPRRTIELMVEPISDSQDAQFTVEVNIAQRWHWPFGSIPSIHWATTLSSVSSWLEAKLVSVSVVVRTLHQGLPAIRE